MWLFGLVCTRTMVEAPPSAACMCSRCVHAWHAGDDPSRPGKTTVFSLRYSVRKRLSSTSMLCCILGIFVELGCAMAAAAGSLHWRRGPLGEAAVTFHGH
eukprot:1290983-Prymnesium_polylepis.1